MRIWSDAAVRKLTRPGHAGIGAVGKVHGETVLQISEDVGAVTHHVAEYMAATAALKRAAELGATRVTLHADSKVVVNQFTGEWRCNDPDLQLFLQQLRETASRFEAVEIRWIPREQNREADRLARAAIA